MITELRVRDLATIDDVTLSLGEGLNVLTGETGAGKSMLVDALGLLLGGRAESGLVRPGAAKTIVEGALEVKGAALRRLEEIGLDADEHRVVIRREVSAEGRSRAWVNGSPTTNAVLADLGALLVDLHGQHETESLMRGDAQRDILDAFADADGDRAAVAEAHGAVSQLRREMETLERRRDEVRRRADYLRHVVAEIDRAKLQPGEDAKLDQEARRLGQASTLSGHAARLAEALGDAEGGAQEAMSRAERAL
ncbi:MAG TPA: AAA family ATPase, partial [Gemmatimonadales bacterium]|nr:AAA family ATPase [Gemmatimonadales bacterium]